MTEINQLEMKYFVLKLKEEIDIDLLRGKLNVFKMNNDYPEIISGNDLAVLIVNCIIKDEKKVK